MHDRKQRQRNQGLFENRKYDQRRGIFRLMKPFFCRNTLRIARKKWCPAGGKDPLFGRVDGFQIGPKS